MVPLAGLLVTSYTPKASFCICYFLFPEEHTEDRGRYSTGSSEACHIINMKTKKNDTKIGEGNMLAKVRTVVKRHRHTFLLRTICKGRYHRNKI